MHEKSRLPHAGRAVEDGVSGRTGDLSQAVLGATEAETDQEHCGGLTAD